MALIDRVKLNLGISHNEKDSEINADITAARAELIRSGVSEDSANGDNPLIEDAILQYVLYRMAASRNDDYRESWLYQQDCLRRSKKYAGANHDE